jgi:pimeloyl-ACP methyl ester carboxylesterase
MRVFYLHGFASSAKSSKALFLSEKLAARGVSFAAPDFNEPDFSTLTVTRMLAQIAQAIDAGPDPVALVGSSLGGFVAVQAALQRPSIVQRLVLLAPALDAGRHSIPALGEGGLEAWRASDTLDVFHYGYGRMVPLRYELYADAGRYDCLNAQLTMPVQVFQGRHDAAVDPALVEGWARSRPYVELHMLDDDHQLHSSLGDIWTAMDGFLFGPSATSKFPDTAPECPPGRS